MADLSFLNPNALHELGIRHTTKKPTIHMAAGGTRLPFDNIHQRTIFFDLQDWNSILKAEDGLKNAAQQSAQPGFIVSNPFVDAALRAQLAGSSDPTEQALSQQAVRIDSLEETVRIFQELVLGSPLVGYHHGVNTAVSPNFTYSPSIETARTRLMTAANSETKTK